MLLLRVADLDQTHAVSEAVAGLVRAGDIIVLSGEMGAGKTAFAQGLGRALGISEPITSPTFTLVRSYPTNGRLTMHHADLYRLDRTVDVEELALPELASYRGFVLVEWGDVATAALGDHLEVHLSRVDDEPDDEPDDREHPGEGGGEGDNAGPAADDDFADNGKRQIELHAAGPGWSSRWDRLSTAVEKFRC